MNPREQETLIQRFVDGELDDAACEKVVAFLKADPQAFESYCQYAELDAGLQHLTSGAARLSASPRPHLLDSRDAGAWRSRLIAVASAAAVVTLLAGLLFLTLAPKPLPNLALRSTPGSHLQITHLATGKDAPAPGTLEPGSRLHLTQGSIELTFASGVRSVIVAPADLTMVRKNRLHLLEGSGFFEVPPGAEGFTVQTAELEIIDLGTEFAVLATPSAGDQIHVIRGRVKATNRNGQPTQEILRAGQAREAGPTGRLNAIPLRPADFTRTLPSRLPYLHWSFDGDDPITPKGTLLGAGTVSSSTEGGAIVPSERRRVSGTNGYALGFTEESDRIVTDWLGFTGRVPRTFACWIRLDPANPDSWQSIIEWGAHHQQATTYNTYWRVRTILNPATNQCNLRVSYGNNWIDGSMHLADGRWHHIAVTESRQVNDQGLPQLRFYVDGKEDHQTLINQGPTFNVSTQTGVPLSIGTAIEENHHFEGTLDELFLFEGELSEKSIRELMQSTAPSNDSSQ